ncbi:MAG: cupredoxin domain-containing protein [Candidatus Roizmanbacteria bacterium]
MKNKNLVVGFVLFVLIVGIGWMMIRRPGSRQGLSKNTETAEVMEEIPQKTTIKMQKVPPVTAEVADDASSSVKTIAMEAGSFYFMPNIITVKEGTTVKITFSSVSMMHNFYLDEFAVKGPTVKSGNTETFEFIASKKGTYEYYCAIGAHRANGQVGTLIVE